MAGKLIVYGAITICTIKRWIFAHKYNIIDQNLSFDNKYLHTSIDYIGRDYFRIREATLNTKYI